MLFIINDVVFNHFNFCFRNIKRSRTLGNRSFKQSRVNLCQQLVFRHLGVVINENFSNRSRYLSSDVHCRNWINDAGCGHLFGNIAFLKFLRYIFLLNAVIPPIIAGNSRQQQYRKHNFYDFFHINPT